MNQENERNDLLELTAATSSNELIERLKFLEKENAELRKKLAKNSAKKPKLVRFTMRVGETEYEQIKQKAEAVRRPVSSFLTEAALARSIMLPEDAAAHRQEIGATAFELKKIGNNLNQAVHLAHLESRFLEARALVKISAEIAEVIERVKKHL